MSEFISGAPGTAAFAYFSVPGSTLVKTGPGSLRAVSIGVAAANGHVKLFDGLSVTGRLIADLDASAGRDIDFNAQFSTGLFVVVVGNPNVTVIYS